MPIPVIPVVVYTATKVLAACGAGALTYAYVSGDQTAVNLQNQNLAIEMSKMASMCVVSLTVIGSVASYVDPKQAVSVFKILSAIAAFITLVALYLMQNLKSETLIKQFFDCVPNSFRWGACYFVGGTFFFNSMANLFPNMLARFDQNGINAFRVIGGLLFAGNGEANDIEPGDVPVGAAAEDANVQGGGDDSGETKADGSLSRQEISGLIQELKTDFKKGKQDVDNARGSGNPLLKRAAAASIKKVICAHRFLLARNLSEDQRNELESLGAEVAEGAHYAPATVFSS